MLQLGSPRKRLCLTGLFGGSDIFHPVPARYFISRLWAFRDAGVTERMAPRTPEVFGWVNSAFACIPTSTPLSMESGGRGISTPAVRGYIIFQLPFLASKSLSSMEAARNFQCLFIGHPVTTLTLITLRGSAFYCLGLCSFQLQVTG